MIIMRILNFVISAENITWHLTALRQRGSDGATDERTTDGDSGQKGETWAVIFHLEQRSNRAK